MVERFKNGSAKCTNDKEAEDELALQDLKPIN